LSKAERAVLKRWIFYANTLGLNLCRKRKEAHNFMTDIPIIYYILAVLFSLIVSWAVLYLLRWFWCWFFKIDEIVKLLKQIAHTEQREEILSNQTPTSTDKICLQLCEGCKRNFDRDQLRKIASGQMLCPDCVKDLKQKSR
jgi:hypothetical protein